MRGFKTYFPILGWAGRYGRSELTSDLLAAVIVTIMLVPQSLAYAMLAGLPAEVGLYASIVPIVLYALFGTSRSLAVGPVAIIALMTATAIGGLGLAEAEAMAAALVLALLSGGILFAMGLLRLGFLANFLPHTVTAGFVTASALLIAAGQFGQILGISARGDTMPEIVAGIVGGLGEVNLYTLTIGLVAIVLLFWARARLKKRLLGLGLRPALADGLSKAAPILVVVLSTLAAWALDLSARGVALVGAVPGGLPPLTLPGLPAGVAQSLLLPALLIALVGFVESVSVGQTLAARRRERIDPDQELLGLGAANIGAAFTGGMPVTGGFSRSIVNHDAGAATPAAGILTAAGLLLATLMLTPALALLPKATLSATIIVAVIGLIDLSILRQSWDYSRRDFAAVALTIGATLLAGVEAGLLVGVGTAVALHLYASSRPHIAEVGFLPGTHHFRNLRRHGVVTDPSLLTVRVDESLYFANARYLEEYLSARLAEAPSLRHVVVMCTAVNDIDLSGMESLGMINHRLKDAGITLHLSEVKGPVMDKLRRSAFVAELSGEVFLSQVDALRALTPRAAPPELHAMAA